MPSSTLPIVFRAVRPPSARALRRGVLLFLIALACVVVLGCASSPFEPDAGKVKLSGAPKVPEPVP